MRALEAHLGVVTCLARSASDDGLLLSGSEDCSVRAWRWDEEENSHAVVGKHASAVWSTGVQSHLAVSTATEAKLWDLRTS